MILSRRGLLVTVLGLPAAALARPQASARPVAIADMNDVVSALRDVGDEFIAAQVGALRRGDYSALRGHPPYRGHRRPS